MKTVKRTIPVELVFYEGSEDPKRGIFEGGVQDPEYTEELELEVAEDEAFNESEDQFTSTGRLQVHLRGSRRAFAQFARYLLALSHWSTSDPDPHDHFENVRDRTGGRVHLIVHAPSD